MQNAKCENATEANGDLRMTCVVKLHISNGFHFYLLLNHDERLHSGTHKSVNAVPCAIADFI